MCQPLVRDARCSPRYHSNTFLTQQSSKIYRGTTESCCKFLFGGKDKSRQLILHLIYQLCFLCSCICFQWGVGCTLLLTLDPLASGHIQNSQLQTGKYLEIFGWSLGRAAFEEGKDFSRIWWHRLCPPKNPFSPVELTLCTLVISCNFGRFPGPTGSLATLAILLFLQWEGRIPIMLSTKWYENTKYSNIVFGGTRHSGDTEWVYINL